jgi:hypothetical protein
MPTELFADVPIVDPDKDYFEELVGEGKKYSDPKELAKATAYKDQHIAQIEDENKRMRDELATRIKYEDFLDKLEKLPQVGSRDPQDDDDSHKDMSAMRPEEVERLLEQKLSQLEAQKAAQQNLNYVRSELEKALGPNYVQHLKRQMNELGMTEAEVQRMAQSNPKVLLRALAVSSDSKDNIFQAPPKGTNSSFSLSPSKKKGDSYFEEIRKKDPTTYWTPQIQNEIFNSIQEMGADEFYKN